MHNDEVRLLLTTTTALSSSTSSSTSSSSSSSSSSNANERVRRTVAGSSVSFVHFVTCRV
jgi:hypothetical protein